MVFRVVVATDAELVLDSRIKDKLNEPTGTAIQYRIIDDRGKIRMGF